VRCEGRRRRGLKCENVGGADVGCGRVVKDSEGRRGRRGRGGRG
jgi:hypothetical protein